MTVLRNENAWGFGSDRAKRVLVKLVFIGAGFLAGMGISWIADVGETPTVHYGGAMVDRSLAMERNHAALTRSGEAQAKAMAEAGASIDAERLAYIELVRSGRIPAGANQTQRP